MNELGEVSSPHGKSLVCEDEGLIALDLQNTLERYGFHVAGVVDNGADALMLAEHVRPDIVFSARWCGLPAAQVTI